MQCFFYNGKNFMLCRGAEHGELKFPKLTRDFTSDGLLRFTYTKNHSKNRCGGFNQLDIENKTLQLLLVFVLDTTLHVVQCSFCFHGD